LEIELNLIEIYYLYLIFNFSFYIKYIINIIGDWGLGIGDWGLGIRPNPQSPIPNPQSPIPNKAKTKLFD